MSDRCVPRGRALSTQSRTERGAVAVEFALVLPILVMLLFGITSAGLSYTNAIGVTNAVREGARFGATTAYAVATPTVWPNDVITRVRATQFDDGTTLATSTTAVCAELWKVGATAPTTSACSTSGNTPALAVSSTAPSLTGMAAGTCVVRVRAARFFEIQTIVAPPWKRTVIRTSVAKGERATC